MKIDCNITENYLKEKARMLTFYNRGINFDGSDAGETIAMIQNFSDANPQKTYLEDLKEKFSALNFGSIGHPNNCPRCFGYKNLPCDGTGYFQDREVGCNDCWNQIMEEAK